MNASKSNGLASISIEHLYAGLILNEDIYNYNGTMMLVKKDTTLTDVLIEQLKKFNGAEKNIRVSQKLYEQLLERGIPQKLSQRYLEDTTKYTEIKNQTKSLITLAEITSRVPYEQVCNINEHILERLKVTDPALLFQCINGNNEVDEYLYRHSVNVALINGLMGKWLNLPAQDITDLVTLGLVHDIGKVRVPNDVLNSSRKLTEREFEHVKRHTVYSHEMLLYTKEFPREIANAARYHHEKMNGSGYPEGLAADDIPLPARITAVSDVYDAMVSKRSYKNAQSPFGVLNQMKEERLWGLDITLVNVFTEQMPRELLGKSVLLSNGMVAVVRHVNDMNIEYPIVEIEGDVIVTNKDLYCVSMVIDEDI